MLLSFERPARRRRSWASALEHPGGLRLFPDLENCTVANDNGYHRAEPQGFSQDHRQDSKGTWWMPWHLESKKGVDDCDKPR